MGSHAKIDDILYWTRTSSPNDNIGYEPHNICITDCVLWCRYQVYNCAEIQGSAGGSAGRTSSPFVHRLLTKHGRSPVSGSERRWSIPKTRQGKGVARAWKGIFLEYWRSASRNLHKPVNVDIANKRNASSRRDKVNRNAQIAGITLLGGPHGCCCSACHSI